MKKWLIGGSVVFVFLICIGLIFYTLPQTESPKKESAAKTTTSPPLKSKVTAEKTPDVPTIFVHGYAGTKNSLGNMIKRLSKNGQATKSLVLTVNADGTVSTSGQFDETSPNPLIQILFADNKSSMENQTIWLENALATLKNEYHIEKINAVGHSMGGVSLTNYLEKDGHNAAYPQVEKLVLIAAPLNGLVIGEDGVTPYDLTDNGPGAETDRYANFMNGQAGLPSDLQVFNIAGDIEDGTKSDGSVSVASALSGRFIYADVASYSEKIFYGENAAHSKLHENPDVDQTIADFLWSD
ncbi:alpha/beta fold hydrolase [Listeria costaricensis]|uniref:alpha/beta fold hydrolase n=1 Tax=Listeria costaricensis TaxID=2026604 RepID=UPI000C085CB8|nr:alpha/beta fold hydrolase [Listeria costaricensis]